jgi:hypothetical protein
MGLLDALGIPQLPEIKLLEIEKLPIPGIEEPHRLIFDLATGRKSAAGLFKETALNLGEQAMDAMAPDWAKRRLANAAGELAEARGRWIEWLKECEFALITIWGAPGEGKTTLTSDLADRFFEPAGRDVWTLGLPEALFPSSWRAMPLGKLHELGAELKRLESDPNAHPDAIKQLLSEHFPRPFVLLVDDAGLYTAKGGENPVKRALRAVINERRHLGAVIVGNCQVVADIDRVWLRSDAYLIKVPDMLAMGPPDDESGEQTRRPADREEVGAWVKYALPKLLRIPDPETRRLTVFVACMLPDVQFTGLWRHQRPSWYGQAQSHNAVIFDAGDLDEDAVIDADFAEQLADEGDE